MKKHLFSLTLVILLGGGVLAQKNEGKKEIIIEKKLNGGKPEKTVIIIDGDKVTVNGEEVKDLNGKLNMLNNSDFDFRSLGKAFDNSQFHFKNFGDSFPAARLFNKFGNASRSNKAMLGVVTDKDEKGAKITEVTGESGAANAGLQKDDIITAVNGDKIADGGELVKAMGKYKPEEVVDVTALRNGAEKKFKVTLGKNTSAFSGNWNWNGNDDAMPPFPPMGAMPDGAFQKPDGFNGFRGFAMNNDRPKFGFGIKDNENGDGAVVTNIKDESAAAKAGLKESDIVTEVGGTPVKTTDDLKRLLAENKDKTEIIVKVLRNGSPQTLTLKVPKKIKTAEL